MFILESKWIAVLLEQFLMEQTQEKRSFKSAQRTIGSLGCEQSMKHFQHHQVNALLLAYTVIQTLRSLLN